MRNVKDNGGFTLLELIITIAVGSIITVAAVAVLLLGLRIYHHSTENATRQSNVHLGLTVIDTLLAEGTVTRVDSGEILTEGGTDLLIYDPENKAIFTGAGALVMENVTGFDAGISDDDLITYTVTLGDGTAYTSSVYCRSVVSLEGASGEAMLDNVIGNQATEYQIREFLKILRSQLGSGGQILEDGQPMGVYYSEWYIGSYEQNPGWNADTPWCACFVSWAFDKCRQEGLMTAAPPRYAEVDSFSQKYMAQGPEGWRNPGVTPAPGDIVFFDWGRDADPDHVGIVCAVDETMVYTIEGNSSGRVRLKQYALGSAVIYGYAIPAWNAY